MRTVVAALLCLVATLATVVTIGAGWTAVNIQDEDGFVTLSSRLGDDPEVQQNAAALAGEAFADQSGVPVLHEQVAGAVRDAVLRLTQADGWSDAWRETMRRTHERLHSGATPTDVRSDVAPIVRVALDEVSVALPIDLSSPDELLVTVSQEDPTRLVEATSRAAEVAVVAGGAAVLAGLLAVAVARRRSTTIAALGLGVVLAAGAWWIVGRWAVPRFIARGTEDTAYGPGLHDVLADRVVASLDMTLVWVALAGVALAAVGLVSRARRP